MKASPIRGAVLVALAVILGALVLFQGLDDSPTTEIAVGETASADPTVAAGVIATAVVSVPAEVATSTSLPFAAPAPATTLKHAPSEVTVQVANAADVDGLATLLSRRLGQRNYVVRTATNAEVKATTSTVYYQEGYDGDAQEIIQNVFALDIAMVPMPDPPPGVSNPEPGGVNILIVAGSDELSRS